MFFGEFSGVTRDVLFVTFVALCYFCAEGGASNLTDSVAFQRDFQGSGRPGERQRFWQSAGPSVEVLVIG